MQKATKKVIKRPTTFKSAIARINAIADNYSDRMVDYDKNRELWLAQHMEERKMIADFPDVKKKVSELCERFDQHLEDEQKQREADKIERAERQAHLDDRLASIEGQQADIKGAIGQILDIKRSTEIMLKVAKWFAVVAGAIAAVIKLILPFIKHKTSGG